MKLEWMGDNRYFVEALMHYCNVYAASYKTEKMEYEGVTYSYSQIQVIEDLLENEERREMMSVMAARLGITKSNFTKIINRLESKGLVEREKCSGSQKELTVTVTAFGRELYDAYVKDIMRWHFSKMFEAMKDVPAEDRRKFGDALNNALKESKYVAKIENRKQS